MQREPSIPLKVRLFWRRNDEGENTVLGQHRGDWMKTRSVIFSDGCEES